MRMLCNAMIASANFTVKSNGTELQPPLQPPLQSPPSPSPPSPSAPPQPRSPLEELGERQSGQASDKNTQQENMETEPLQSRTGQALLERTARATELESELRAAVASRATVEFELRAEKASRADVAQELLAEKAVRRDLDQKLAALERSNQAAKHEIQKLRGNLTVSTAQVATQSGAGRVDEYSTGTDTAEQVSVLKGSLEKLNGKRDIHGIGQIDIDSILHQVFTWLREESDLYVLKPDGYDDSATGFLRGEAEAKVFAAFKAAGVLRPHPSVDDSMFRATHGAAIPRGTGVQHVDLEEFQSLLGLDPHSKSLVMLNPHSPRQERCLATPPQTGTPTGCDSGRRPVPGGHRFAIGGQRLKGENRTPVKCALEPVAPGERVLQLNMDALQASVAKHNSYAPRISRPSPRSPRLARGRYGRYGRPSVQAHSDGSGSLPAGLNDLVDRGVIGVLKPKLVVNWDLDHLQQRRPDTSAEVSTGRSDRATASAQSSIASLHSSSSRTSMLRSSGVPAPLGLPTYRGLLDAGPSLSDLVPADDLPPPMGIAHVDHKFDKSPARSLQL